ncbi:hypothetical protein ELH20_03780 [Rhizobium ruizarguesonis]|nr:hypothetical protein ELH20_03780 [Rhizobium ruizarguesonis]
MAAPAARAAGLEVWLDKDELQAGAVSWQQQLEGAIGRATAFCVYVGSQGVTNWVEREVRLGLSRATGEGAIPFIPVLAAEARSATLPPFARQHQAIRDPLGSPDALTQFLAAVLGVAQRPVLVEEPFVGLRSMDEAEAHFFFGRARELQDLIGKLQRHSIVAVVADSGTGKSSLVRAGLAPAFRGGQLDPHNRLQPEGVCRHVVVVRPGANALEGLKSGVDKAADGLGLSGDARASLRRRIDLHDASETAYAIRCDLPGKTETLLIVDQFEELLTQVKAEDARLIVDLVLALVDPGAARNIRIVLTIRSDYFNLLSVHQRLFDSLNVGDGAAQLRLKRISDDGLAQLVHQALKMAGHMDVVEQHALVAAIRRDVSDQPGDMALIQMVLFVAWRKARQDRSSLLAAYSRVQGVVGALAHEAERVRNDVLNDQERGLLLPLFARLVRLGDTGGAMRRAAWLKELGTARSTLSQKLGGEDGGRLLQISDDAAEISHEALITQWPWLQNEIQQAAPEIRRLGRLSDATAEWEAKGRTAAALPNDATRKEFDNLSKRHTEWLSDNEGLFLNAAEGRARRARIVGVAVVVTLILLAAGMGLFGLRARQSEWQAQREAWFAKRNEAGALAALASLALREGRPIDAAKLSLAAWPRRPGSGPQIRPALSVPALPELRERVRIDVCLGTDSVAFSPDRTRLATGCLDGTARLWNLATGREVARFDSSDGGSVASLAFSPDGTRLAAGSLSTVQLWEVATGKEVARFENLDEFFSLAFSPDGSRLAAAYGGGTALWDLGTGEKVAWFAGFDAKVISLAFSPDGARLAIGSSDKMARLWDVGTGKEIVTFTGHDNSVSSVAFSPNGTLLATGSYDKTARLWDVATGKEIMRFQGHMDNVASVTFSPDGARLATGSGDTTARIWDLASGKEVARFEGTKDAPTGVFDAVDPHQITSVAFSRDGTLLAAGSYDGVARLWDARGTEIFRFQGDSVAFSPDGRRLATVWDKTARILDLASGRNVVAFVGHNEPVKSVAFSPNGTRLATASEDGLARLWDVATGKEVARFESPEGFHVLSVAFSSDGKRLATGDNKARLWDVATGTEIVTFVGHNEPITSVAISQDGTRLATGSYDKTARLWDVATGKEIMRFQGHGDTVWSVALSTDGTRLATGSGDSTARLWDIATGKEVARFASNTVSDVAFSQDGTRLAVSGSVARLWDVVTGIEIARFPADSGQPFTGIAVSPDGHRLAAGSSEGTGRLWDLSNIPPGNAFVVACASLPIFNGIRDADLTAALKGTEIEIKDPICGPGYDPPTPWWMMPGAKEPQAPEKAQ